MVQYFKIPFILKTKWKLPSKPRSNQNSSSSDFWVATYQLRNADSEHHPQNTDAPISTQAVKTT